MAFDVSKFLALTVLIAGTGAACSSEDKDDPNNGGGKPTAGAPDKGGDAGADNGGAGSGKAGEGSLGGEGGSTSTDGGTTGMGGGNEGGNAGAGGDAPTEPCLSNALLMGEGGAGGAGALDVDPSLEGLCMDFFNLECPGLEDYAPAYTVCEGAKQLGLTITATTVAECLTALSVEDQCNAAKATACFDDLIGKACESSESAAPCTAILASCTDGAPSAADCKQVVDLLNPETIADVTSCMDPGEEGVWDEAFEGDCSERLVVCARRPFF